jgi:hypothetical protein
MHKLEAIKILETKLAAIEQEHHAECAGNDDMLDQADAKAEAKALAAVFDFLKDCKISHGDSLLRILERYLRRKSSGGRRRDAPVTQGAKGILAGMVRAQTDADLRRIKPQNGLPDATRIHEADQVRERVRRLAGFDRSD